MGSFCRNELKFNLRLRVVSIDSWTEFGRAPAARPGWVGCHGSSYITCLQSRFQTHDEEGPGLLKIKRSCSLKVRSEQLNTGTVDTLAWARRPGRPRIIQVRRGNRAVQTVPRTLAFDWQVATSIFQLDDQ